MIKETTFRLKNLKEFETPNGIAWTADITKAGKVVGDVFDDSRGVVPSFSLGSKELYKEFKEWSTQYGDKDWLDIDLEAAGLYKLSEIYAVEVEGVTV
jgi:hypothetical protein